MLFETSLFKILIRRVGGIAVCALVLAAAGCGSGPRETGPTESTLERIRRTGVVRIAYANEAPFGYKDPETGEVTGEAPEVAQIVLGQMGVERIEPTLIGFNQLIPGLQAGRFDLIAAGMYITPARCRQIDFSNPTYSVGEAFLVQKGNPKDLHSFGDLLQTEAMLGVVGGTFELRVARTVGIPESQLAIFPGKAMALAALQAGRIDAFAGTALTIEDLLKKVEGAGLERAEPFIQPRVSGQTRNYGAFGFRSGDDAFRRAFNEQLEDFVGSEEHLQLMRRFGFGRENLPGDVTAEELCEGSAS